MMNWWQELGTAVLIVILAWVLGWVSRWILQWVTAQITGRTKTNLDDAVVTAAQMPLRLVIFAGGIELALQQISTIPLSWEAEIERIFFVIYALAVFIFLYRLVGGVIRWSSREIAHKTDTDLDDNFLDLFRYIAQIGLTVTVIIIVLGRFGIEVSALVTALGIGSLAVALAAQETLGNMLAGLQLWWIGRLKLEIVCKY